MHYSSITVNSYAYHDETRGQSLHISLDMAQFSTNTKILGITTVNYLQLYDIE